MRVLHCVPNMAGGGAERQLGVLAEAQHRAGTDVHVALIAGGPNLPRLERSGAELHWIRASTYSDPRVVFRLRTLMRDLAPDVVQTWILQMDVTAGLAASSCGTPWILSERSSAPPYAGTAKGRLRRRLGRRASAIVANSTAGADYWRPALGRAVPIHVVPNAVPIDEIEAAPPLRASDDPRPVVLFVGRLGPEKNLPTLLTALADVLPRLDARALFCGEGSERAFLIALAARLGLGDRVAFAGYRDDVWGLMKTAAVFASVSWFEGNPNTVLEAMACGCPVVVSDIPQHREFLDESTAWLTPPDQSSALATALVAALTDRTAATAKAAAAAAQVVRLTPAHCADQYDGVYRRVIAAGRAPR